MSPLPENDSPFAPDLADEEGLVAVGLDLEPETLLHAYRSGVFPWFDDSLPILWWSPDPRAIIELNGLHVSRSLARTLRRGEFTTTVDRDFVGVMLGCQEDRADGTWIVPQMVEAYSRLHGLGHAHSVEVWYRGELAGGIYGVSVGGLFAAESMFTRITDASKVAMVAMMARLNERGYHLLDVQIINDHTARMGAIEIPRESYLRRLREALTVDCRFAD